METLNSTVKYTGRCLLCLIALVLAALPVIWLVYLGIYSFNNPDKPAWYGLIDGKPSLFANQEEATASNATELTNIHERFVAWFTWGFFQSLAPLLLAPFIASCMVLSPELGSACAIGSCCLMSCNALAWWTTGIIWRFKADGSYSSGDLVDSQEVEGALLIDETLL